MKAFIKRIITQFSMFAMLSGFYLFNSYAEIPRIQLTPDIPYGEHPKQKLDVYSQDNFNGAPVIVMVHGGAWRGGDKSNGFEYKNKVDHWVNRGFIFVSINYRTLPTVKPIDQTNDVVAAMAFVQKKARAWGGDGSKVILMGHSSGAHLVSLVSARYQYLIKGKISPWLATVSLDISGYDILKKVHGEHPSEFYRDLFGSDKAELKKASPYYVLDSKIPDFLAVCSSRSKDACTQAKQFVEKARSFDSVAETLPADLSHMEISSQLGKLSCYTQKVDAFIASLDSRFKDLLDYKANLDELDCTKLKSASSY